MSAPDPQHQAVAMAADALATVRHHGRTDPAKQSEYLHDLEDLAAEVILAMREANVGEKQVAQTYQRLRRDPVYGEIMNHSEDNLELIARSAFEQRRSTLHQAAVGQRVTPPSPATGISGPDAG